MLNNNRNVRLDDTRIIDSVGDRFGIGQIIKPKMLCTIRRHGHAIRTYRSFIREVDRYLHMGILIGYVEEASRLVADHLRFGSVA